MKLLIAGANGMLGGQLHKQAVEGGFEVVGVSRQRQENRHGHALLACDLGDAEAVRDLVATHSPDWVINCAAFTKVDDCESETERAFLGNAEVAANLATACKLAEAALFQVSTDYVFDGTLDRPYVESDQTNPQSVYGQSKLAGEKAVVNSGAKHCIARIQWLYGEGGPNFADTILRLSHAHDELKVVDDQYGSPSYTVHVAREILRMVRANCAGLYHLSSQGHTTWYGFAKALIEAEGRPDYPVHPTTTAEFPRPAPRPGYSVLENKALIDSIGDQMPHWRDGVQEYMESRKQ